MYSRKYFEKFIEIETFVLKWFLVNFKLFCYSDFWFLYIYKKFFEKFMKTENIVFKTIQLIFRVISGYFITYIFLFLYIHKNILKNL